MNVYVQQTISIQFLKVNSVSNSSVLQIGSAGIIKPATHLYNTGGFVGPAPQIQKPISMFAAEEIHGPLVPLTSRLKNFNSSETHDNKKG